MRVAAIDCGTNSIRLLISDEGSDVARRMEIVRLGEGVDRTGTLSERAIERTRQALLGYAAEIAELGVQRVRMVATSASRDASNADDFRAMVKSVLGVAPEVITGDEEASLSFLGAVRDLAGGDTKLVVDIGGGSTEFITGVTEVDAAISVDIGCVRMTERHLRGDPPTPEEIAAAERDITTAVGRALGVVGNGTLVGLAGSVTTVAALALDLPEYDAGRIHHSRISYDDVARVTAGLLRMTVEERLALPVMHPGRADVIGAGALILRIVMELAEQREVIASEHDILDGIAAGLSRS
jgi:exopolyphosphatase / guanosine-5'-triphosphate,3'-diphosphate pyrophosphatase